MSNSRPMVLWSLFTLQVICTVFFAGDALQDLFGSAETNGETNELLEVGVALSLILGTAFTGWELRHVFRREEKMQQQIDVASGAFAELLQNQFDRWALTEAEQSVALLGIKGYSISEIAQFRDTKEGTVKAQNAAVYRKANVSGRLQLISHFIEDLMGDALISSAKTKTSRAPL